MPVAARAPRSSPEQQRAGQVGQQGAVRERRRESRRAPSQPAQRRARPRRPGRPAAAARLTGSLPLRRPRPPRRARATAASDGAQRQPSRARRRRHPARVEEDAGLLRDRRQRGEAAQQARPEAQPQQRRCGVRRPGPGRAASAKEPTTLTTSGRQTSASPAGDGHADRPAQQRTEGAAGRDRRERRRPGAHAGRGVRAHAPTLDRALRRALSRRRESLWPGQRRAARPGPDARTRRGTTAGSGRCSSERASESSRSCAAELRRRGRAARRSGWWCSALEREPTTSRSAVRLALRRRRRDLRRRRCRRAARRSRSPKRSERLLGDRVVGLVGQREQPHLAAQLAEVALEGLVRARRGRRGRARVTGSAGGAAGHLVETPVMTPSTPSSLGEAGGRGEPDDLAVGLDLGAPGVGGARHDAQPAPEGEQQVVLVAGPRRGAGQHGALARGVAHLDARVLAGAAHPDPDRRRRRAAARW